MDFYESISQYYDLIFPADTQAVAFLASKTGPRSRILDIACGTGSHSLALAGQAREVIGVDLDPAMIRAARAKARACGLQVEFRVMDMLSMAESLEAGFDMLFCIGNSLVHLETSEQIASMLRDCRALLKPGGALVVQIINYDRILAKGETSLPTLRDESAGLEFLRFYDLDRQGDAVIFRTELRVGKAGRRRVIRNRIHLRILKSAQLLDMIEAAGFGDAELFGGFDGRPFDLHCLPLVLSARRG
jgi:glycine/sarcosine N-methyltransferase